MIYRRPLLATALSLAFATAGFGQGEVTAPTTPSGEAAPPGTMVGTPRLVPPGSTGTNVTTPDAKPSTDTPLMPDQQPSLVPPETTPAPKTKASKTAVFEQGLLEKIRYRQAWTQANGDPAIRAQWELSFKPKTDAERRLVLKQYYKLLYTRMAKIDPTLKTQIDVKALEAEHRLTQTRITPTEVNDDSERSTAARVFAD